jgi:two-component system, cell cycle response regulator DivK
MALPRVLVVDDNALNIELAEFLLSAAGMTVDSASNAAQALEQLAGSVPDVILMDIQMAGMDGLALTRQLKADPRTAGIAIVAFTAYAMRGDEARLRAAGCDGYISKPIDVAHFASQVLAFAPFAPAHGHG